MSRTAGRGSKIAELRKFFDSAAANSDSSSPGSKHRDKHGDKTDSERLKPNNGIVFSPQSDIVTNVLEKCEIATESGDTCYSGVNSANSVHLNTSSLWNGVDTGSNNRSANSSEACSTTSERYVPNTSLSSSSTSELNSLIAATKAELSKTELGASIPEKSTLENYFTYAFEDGSSSRNGVSKSNEMFVDDDPRYDCDGDELFFEDLDDGVISDTSSDEEMRCHSSPPSSHHLQPFSLHTIIEESCEESERESQNATPTNQGPASKLEKYFSWDIVNEANVELKKRSSLDESTLYSDSLSEASSSLNGEENDVEPSPLSSSRLEKYFMSGLVGNENYHYPDDAEFLDDTSISDFDDDDRYHKISRSALLTSLDLKSLPQGFETFNLAFNQKPQFSAIDEETEGTDISEGKEEVNHKVVDNVKRFSDVSEKYMVLEESPMESDKTGDLEESRSSPSKVCDVVFLDDYTLSEKSSAKAVNEDSNDLNSEVSIVQEESLMNNEDCPENTPISNDPLINVETNELLTDDPKIILNKIMSQMNETPEESETNYISAWRLLENEIEQLMSHVTINSASDNNSRTSSTIGSSNSDYGSDTVDSGECLTTDEDDNCSDLKNKTEPGQNFKSFDETMVYRKFVESLKSGELAHCLKLSEGESNQVQCYIRDCIASFVKTLNHNRNMAIMEECEKVDSENIMLLLEDRQIKDPESFNKNQKSVANIHDITHEVAVIDEGISVDSTENLSTDCDSGLIDYSNINNELVLSSVPEKVSDIKDSLQDEDVMVSSSDSVECDNSVQDTLPSPSDGKEELIENDESLENIDMPKTSETPAKDSSSSGMNESHSSLDDTTSQFSVYVDIQIGDHNTSVKERTSDAPTNCSLPENATQRSSFRMWVSQDEKANLSDSKSKNFVIPNPVDDPSDSEFIPSKTSFRDTGYYSFKSSEDSMLYGAESENDLVDSRAKSEFSQCSRRSSVKSTSSAAALSHSTTNIPEEFDASLKFSTLQPKSRTLKVSMNPLNSSPGSPSFTSFFSPSAVLKKLKPNKNEVSYPSKYLKKYGRSYSVDNDSIYGATSMPHLGVSSDSCSMNGGMESDRVSSLTLDDEIDGKYSHSILSLGAHSASTTSVYSAAGGRHFGYVSITGDVLFGLNYNQKSQTMEVFVKQCRNLAAADLRKNKSDPYVKVYLLPDKSKSGKRKTKVKRGTLNPIFNELLRFPVLKHELETRTLWMSVWNSDLFGRNDFLGEITLNLGYRLLDSPTLRWYPLQERTESLSCPLTYKGEIFLALKYVPKDLSLEPRFRPAPVISLKGALHVLIKEARNIAPGKGSGAFDSFCKCYLLPDKSKGSKQKTPVLKKSRHPKWYYTIIYEDLSVEELKDRSLELTLWDHDTLTSNEFMGAVRLNCGTGLYHGVPVEWMDSTREEASLWCAMLERPNMWVDGSLPLRPSMQSLRS